MASLQRALAARDYYAGPVTSQMDRATIASIRQYQTERGLESGQLSVETARTLGLIAAPLAEIEELGDF